MRDLVPAILLSAVFTAAACQGPAGTAGAEGESGERGEMGLPCWDGLADQNGDGVVDNLDCRGAEGIDGIDGVDGQDAAPLSFVGWQVCAGCHPEEAHRLERSGHAYTLREVDGAAPADLQADLGVTETPLTGNHPSAPPVGYTWDDILFVVGGWGWKTQFLDQSGFVITCPPGDTDSDADGFCDTECAGSAAGSCDSGSFLGQWNQGSDSWASFSVGEFQKPYDCGACHTTGYDPDGITVDAAGDPVAGIIGAWSEPGVRCEACHGPGSRHAADPLLELAHVDRSAELCGRCHASDHVGTIQASAPAGRGFTLDHQQWNEMFSSKKHSMRCIDCHDPHQSARFADTSQLPDSTEAVNPTRSIRLSCESCHFLEAVRQNNADETADSLMLGVVECVDCHMPYLSRSAEGSFAAFTGDLRSHLFAINPDRTASQFTPDGSEANPYLSLQWACRSCHKVLGSDPQPWSIQTDVVLEESAIGYHD